ncbi:MAG: hypothetical protein K9J79_08845 [Desulfobacteraceae bacterium]|nr:hypothetical protein [Desulfobacteraceae bacterium]
MSENEEQASAFQPSPEYLARAKRMDDAMHLRRPDRVPVAPLSLHFHPTKVRGISNKEAMYNQSKWFQALKEETLKYDWDAAPPPGPVMPAKPLEILGIKQVEWPGGGLNQDQPFQWVENEYMKQDEYDEFFQDPNTFAVKKLWPRVSSTLAPLSDMMQMPPPPLFALSNAYTLPPFLGGMIGQSPLRDIMKKALELADEIEKNTETAIAYVMEMMNLGYPIESIAATFPPFDWVSDSLRGLRGSSMDMLKVPEKLISMIDMITPVTIEGAVNWAQQSQNKGVAIFMHRGAAGFMSNKQYEKFYWPSFKALLLGLVDAGLTPIALFEGDYTPRLEFLQELPPGKIVAHFDRVDRKKAKKLIGDVMCFWGNIPSSLMITGTPQQVKDDVKELIETFGDNGGLIIDSINGFPDESKPENIMAVTEAVREFGVY